MAVKSPRHSSFDPRSGDHCLEQCVDRNPQAKREFVNVFATGECDIGEKETVREVLGFHAARVIAHRQVDRETNVKTNSGSDRRKRQNGKARFPGKIEGERGDIPRNDVGSLANEELEDIDGLQEIKNDAQTSSALGVWFALQIAKRGFQRIAR